MNCEQCGHRFDPIASRWLCPRCGFHNPCCDGAPQPPKEDA